MWRSLLQHMLLARPSRSWRTRSSNAHWVTISDLAFVKHDQDVFLNWPGSAWRTRPTDAHWRTAMVSILDIVVISLSQILGNGFKHLRICGNAFYNSLSKSHSVGVLPKFFRLVVNRVDFLSLWHLVLHQMLCFLLKRDRVLIWLCLYFN